MLRLFNQPNVHHLNKKKIVNISAFENTAFEEQCLKLLTFADPLLHFLNTEKRASLF